MRMGAGQRISGQVPVTWLDTQYFARFLLLSVGFNARYGELLTLDVLGPTAKSVFEESRDKGGILPL